MFVRMRLLCRRPISIRSFLRTRLLWLPPRGRLFVSHRRRALLLLVFVFSFRHPSLSPSLSSEGHSRSDNNTRSLFSKGHSLDLFAQKSPPAYPVRCRQLRALWGSRSLSSESRRCSRPTGRVYTTAKGASRRRPRRHPTQTPPCPLPLGLGAILCAITAAATPPPILLLGRALTL
jgi:hypothetical protein